MEQLSALLTLITIVGFMLLGPGLCMVAVKDCPHQPGVSGLIAAGRIAVDPRATFRPVSGVVLAASAVTYIGSTVDHQSPDKPSLVRVLPGVVQVFTGGGGTGAEGAVGRGRPDVAEDRDDRYEHVVCDITSVPFVAIFIGCGR